MLPDQTHLSLVHVEYLGKVVEAPLTQESAHACGPWMLFHLEEAAANPFLVPVLKLQGAVPSSAVWAAGASTVGRHSVSENIANSETAVHKPSNNARKRRGRRSHWYPGHILLE